MHLYKAFNANSFSRYKAEDSPTKNQEASIATKFHLVSLYPCPANLQYKQACHNVLLVSLASVNIKKSFLAVYEQNSEPNRAPLCLSFLLSTDWILWSRPCHQQPSRAWAIRRLSPLHRLMSTSSSFLIHLSPRIFPLTMRQIYQARDWLPKTTKLQNIPLIEPWSFSRTEINRMELRLAAGTLLAALRLCRWLLLMFLWLGYDSESTCLIVHNLTSFGYLVKLFLKNCCCQLWSMLWSEIKPDKSLSSCFGLVCRLLFHCSSIISLFGLPYSSLKHRWVTKILHDWVRSKQEVYILPHQGVGGTC